MSYITLLWFAELAVIVTFSIFGAWVYAELNNIKNQRSLNRYRTYCSLLRATETPIPRNFRDQETRS
jgi:hypothetical protein